MLKPLKFNKNTDDSLSNREAHVYIIRNTQLRTDWQNVKPNLRSIGSRSISSLIRAQGIGDLFRIFATTQRDKLDFNLTFIPDALDINREDEFDNRVMNLLFEAGYKLAKQRYHWRNVPPGYYPMKKGED
jgi:hypothetical protein